MILRVLKIIKNRNYVKPSRNVTDMEF